MKKKTILNTIFCRKRVTYRRIYFRIYNITYQLVSKV